VRGGEKKECRTMMSLGRNYLILEKKEETKKKAAVGEESENRAKRHLSISRTALEFSSFLPYFLPFLRWVS